MTILRRKLCKWGVCMGNDYDEYNEIIEELNAEGDNRSKTVRTIVSMEACGHMFKEGFTLDQIYKAMPWLTKKDIFGLSYILDTPVSANPGEIEEIKWSYRRTLEPPILAKVFDTPEEKAKRLFRVNAICLNCGEEHVKYNVKLEEDELATLDEFYRRNADKPPLYLLLSKKIPLVIHRHFKCPMCKTDFEKDVAVFLQDEIGYKER